MSQSLSSVAVTAPPTATPASAPLRVRHESSARDRQRWTWIALAGVATVAVALRLGLFLIGPAQAPQRAMYPDSPRYVELAENLVAFGSFARLDENAGVVHIPLAELRESRGELERRDSWGLLPEVFRTPGYPLFVSAFIGLGLSIEYVLIAQCLLGGVDVLLVYLLAMRLLQSPKAALAATAITALHPALCVAAGSVLSEMLFTTLMLLGLTVAAYCRQNTEARWPRYSLAGLLIGLSVLVRPISVLLGPAVAMWMIATDRRWKTAAMACVLAITSLLPAAAWMSRNAGVGVGYKISTVPQVNALFYTVAYMRLAERGGDTARDWPATVRELMGELKTKVQPGEKTLNAAKRLAMQEIRAKPALYIKVLGQSTIKFFTDHSVDGLYLLLGKTYQPTGLRDRLMRGDLAGVSGEQLASALLPAAWAGMNLTLTVLMAAGLGLLAWRRQWAPLLLLAGVLFYFVFTTQTTGLERFRLPVIGVQAIAIAAIVAKGRTVERVEVEEATQ